MINVAIDGPSAAGKSTIAKALAKKFNLIHLDTGAMYRCVALKAKQCNIACDDEDALLRCIASTSIEMRSDGTIILDGVIVKDELRTAEISMMASDVSKLSRVREELVRYQQQLSKNKGYVLDGRDIGTVVLKDAEVKIFLTASVDARAMRRCKEDQAKGIDCDINDIKVAIEKRDYQDTNREHSPLKKADDAIEVDTSQLSIDEVVDVICNIVKERMN